MLMLEQDSIAMGVTNRSRQKLTDFDNFIFNDEET